MKTHSARMLARLPVRSLTAGVVLAGALLAAQAQLPNNPPPCDTAQHFPNGLNTNQVSACGDPLDQGPVCPSPAATGNGGGLWRSPVRPTPGAPALGGGHEGGSGCVSCGGKPAPGHAGPGGGSGDPQCCPEGGMPYWWVNQPYAELFVRDKPFFYNTSGGRQVVMELHFKNLPGTNGAVDTAQPGIFSLGTNWHSPWRSYLQASPSNALTYFCFLGDGSARQYVRGAVEQASRAKLIETEYGLALQFPSGSRNVYGQYVRLGSQDYWFLTRKEDDHGNALIFSYTTNAGSVRLDQVTDADGQETTFIYTNGTYYSNLLVEVQGPYGLTVSLRHDVQERLTNIVDVVGLSAGLEYDASQRLSTLRTPYGPTTFHYYGAAPDWTALRVHELGLRQHLYLEGYSTNNVWPSAASESSALAGFLQTHGLDETVETSDFDERNTFYWGPRQYQNLPSSVQTALTNGTFAPRSLTTNDLQKGWTRHWLRASSLNSNYLILSRSLSVERAPSPDPDGHTEGLLTWYDYADKVDGGRTNAGPLAAPRCQAWREPGGPWRVIYTTHNPLGHPTSITDNYASPTNALTWRTRTFTYSEDHTDLLSEKHDGTNVNTYTYSGYHQVTGHRNALDELTTYEYDARRRLTRITRPNGLITDYTYDANGWLTHTVDRSAAEYFRTNSFTYTNGYLWTHTDERGLTITNVWDALGRLTHTLYPDGTGVTHVYDKLDLVVTYDRLGFTNGYAYNGFRELIRHTNALGGLTQYQYCTCGGLESITDPLNQTTTFTLDPLGRRKRTTYPDNTWTENTYNLQGQIVRVTDSAGVAVTNFYTVNGLLFTASNAFGRVFLRQFDAEDRVLVSVDANGVRTGYAYDALGRLVRRSTSRLVLVEGFVCVPEDYHEYGFGVAGPTNTHRHYVVYYDETLTEPWFTWPFGEVIENGYDLFGRKTQEVHYAVSGDYGELTTPLLTNAFTYSPAGDLLTLTDGKSQVTTWAYDLYGRVTNKWDAAENLIFRYAYDANGRLTSRWTPGTNAATGLTTTYTYDPLGQLTHINYPHSPDITLQYDALGRLTNMLDAVGATRYTYSASGAVASEDGPWASDTVSYTYDNGRRRSGLSLQQPMAAAWAQSYAYDAIGRLTNVTSAAGPFGYTYHPGLDTNGALSPASLVQRLTLPGGALLTNAYDPWARHLATHLRTSGGTLLNGHDYTYNDLDQRIRQTRTGGDYVDYAYDPLGQLIGASGKESGGTARAHEQLKYAYDAAGNLTKRTNNALVQTFNVNTLNELTTVGRSGSYTVAGAVQGTASSVTVNGSAATLYADQTFARTNVSLTDGTNTFALCHVDDTPLALWNPGAEWEGLAGTLSRGSTVVPLRSLAFSMQDPRVVMLPVTAEEARQLGAKVYRIASDPFKFQDAVLVGAREGYYGECRFQIDVSTPDYVQLDRSFLRGLFGKFNPSRGDLVLSKNGELLGIMANNTYCLRLTRFDPAATFRCGPDTRPQNTAQVLALLYNQVAGLPGKLQ